MLRVYTIRMFSDRLGVEFDDALFIVPVGAVYVVRDVLAINSGVSPSMLQLYVSAPGGGDRYLVYEGSVPAGGHVSWQGRQVLEAGEWAYARTGAGDFSLWITGYKFA